LKGLKENFEYQEWKRKRIGIDVTFKEKLQIASEEGKRERPLGQLRSLMRNSELSVVQEEAGSA